MEFVCSEVSRHREGRGQCVRVKRQGEVHTRVQTDRGQELADRRKNLEGRLTDSTQRASM